MATLTIRNVPDELHERLKERAERNRRSLNAETVLLLEQAVESLPEEAELRARFQAARRQALGAASPSGPKDPVYGSEAAPAALVREVATQRGGLDAADVLCRFARESERLRSLGVRRIGLFGSVLRGESRPDSDIDVLVEFDPRRKSFDAFVRLASYLEGLLGRAVELVTTEGLSPYIGPKILEEAEFVTVDAIDD